MSKHTPGPWHWDSDPIKGDPLGRVRYRVTAIGKTVTQCYYSSSDEQAEWDARLIAAATSMFEEIEREYTDLADIRNQWEGRHTTEGQRKLCRLRDLICLATGREAMDVQDDYSTRLIRAKATGDKA